MANSGIARTMGERIAELEKQVKALEELNEELAVDRKKFMEMAKDSCKLEQQLIDERLKNKNQENYISRLQKSIEDGNKRAAESIKDMTLENKTLKDEVSIWKRQYNQLHEVLNAIYVRSADWDSQDEWERNESIDAINKLLTEVACSGYATYVTHLEQKLEKAEKNLEVTKKRLNVMCGERPLKVRQKGSDDYVYLKSAEKIPRLKFIRELFAGIITDMIFDGRTKEEMSILYDFTKQFIDRYNKNKVGVKYE